MTEFMGDVANACKHHPIHGSASASAFWAVLTNTVEEEDGNALWQFDIELGPDIREKMLILCSRTSAEHSAFLYMDVQMLCGVGDCDVWKLGLPLVVRAACWSVLLVITAAEQGGDHDHP